MVGHNTLKAFFWVIFCPATLPVRVIHMSGGTSGSAWICSFVFLPHFQGGRTLAYARVESARYIVQYIVSSLTCINSFSSKFTFCFTFQYPMYIVNLTSSKAEFGLALQYPLYSIKFHRVGNLLLNLK